MFLINLHTIPHNDIIIAHNDITIPHNDIIIAHNDITIPHNDMFANLYTHIYVLSPRDERTLVRKVQINPRTTAKDLVKMLEETGTKVSISTVK